MHSAKILADSVTNLGNRLATLEVTFPRIVLAEFNTHRVFSRNSSSSRAIPVEKMISNVENNPYIPTHWGKNCKGMQSFVELSQEEQVCAEQTWLLARDHAVKTAKLLLDIGVHKQITNRLLEPFMWHTVIVSATDWNNFFHLRCHPDAHPEIRKIAELMRNVLINHIPIISGDWHLPLITEEERIQCSVQDLIKICVGRCARVSYLTHDGKRDWQADINLHDRLLKSGHLSPFEHAATPSEDSNYFGNFKGWKQYRKMINHEHDILWNK